MSLDVYLLGAFVTACLAGSNGISNSWMPPHGFWQNALSLVVVGLAWPLVVLVALGMIVRKVLVRGS